MNIRTVIVALVSLGCLTEARAELTVYVSANAAAGGDGSSRKPCKTLEQARDAVRNARKTAAHGKDIPVLVLVEPGVYAFLNSFELKTQDSGTKTAPVVYRARKRGTVLLSGGVTLEPSAFSKITEASILQRLDASARDKILVCDLSKQIPGPIDSFKTAYSGVPAGPFLYFNQQPMTMARWPNIDAQNKGWAEFSKAVDTGLAKPDAEDVELRKLHPGSFIFDDSRPSRWNVADGVWLQGYWCHDWSDETIRIESYDSEKKILKMAEPHRYGIAGGTWGASKRRFFALNLLDELDAPGEWYLDRTRKLLYFYPPAALKNSTIVLATLTQPLIKVTGASHVKFIDFDLEYCHSDGIVLKDTANIEIAGCTVANCSGTGISIDGSNNVVRSCDLYQLGRSGISLNGGDRKTLAPANNLAVNNHIHHYGLFQRTYAPGIGASGCGQVARNNCIHDAPHNAVLYGGNEHLFELNEIYRVVMETGDAGAFYTGRDWTSRGNMIRHNYIHDLGGGDAQHVNTMGVYLDDCDCGDTIEGNVFYRSGRAIMIGGGRDNTVLNNIVVDCPIALHVDARGTTWAQWNNPSDKSWCLEEKAKTFDYTNHPWSVKYPKLAKIMDEEPRQPLGNTLRRNVFVDCTKSFCDLDGNTRKVLDRLDIAENLAINTTGTNTVAKLTGIKGFANLTGTTAQPIVLGFKNLSGGDLSLNRDARLLKELPTFEKIPFEKIGLLKDEYRTNLPKR